MAREYGKVGHGYWTGDTGRQLRALGDDVRLGGVYLMTCASATMIGLYYLPVALMAYELGWTIEGASQVLRTLEGVGFLSLDPTRDLVWVHEMARYQVGENLKRGDKRIAHIEALLTEHRRSPLADAFRRKYHIAFHLRPPSAPSTAIPGCAPEAPSYGASEGPAKPHHEGKKGPSKPESSEQRTDHTHSAGAREGAAVREMPPPLTRRRNLHAAWEWSRGCVPQQLHADLVVKLGGDPQAAAATLFAFYRETADATPADQVIGDDWRFWREAFDRRFVARAPRPSSASTPSRLAVGAPAAPVVAGDDLWARVVERLPVPHGDRLRWFRGTQLTECSDDRIVVEVPDASQATWLGRHYTAAISDTLAALGSPGRSVIFTTTAEAHV